MELFVYKGVKKDDPISIILIEQSEAGKSIAMFEDPAVKPLIESAGNIYDSTVISSNFLIKSSRISYKYFYL